ncbi:MAG: exodeoxyribonuclease VII large subunit [Marinobacter sp.]|nr:exodeoxyribonuclease VII large subunit [Marinobacter sp.]
MSSTLSGGPRALSVSELNSQARHLLEVSFMQVWVEGELSSFSRPASGHWYFSLKDNRAQVRCAMFRGFNQRVRQTPKDGDKVRIRGKVTLYEGRGDFQIMVEHMEPAGVGDLQQAFEALKAKLQQEGLFDPARKRTLPALPKHIGVVTSPTGAAIHDILTVLKRRFPAIPVTLYPTAVQGDAASAEIVRAIALAERHGKADVLIVGRGGGSLEDLWCFNHESVARAIAQCSIPVVSAVGHEVDFTIADFVADLRAPTPSAAAEKLSPDQQDWLRRLTELQQAMARSVHRQCQRNQTALSHLQQRLRDPRRQLLDTSQKLDEMEARLTHAIKQRQQRLATQFSHLESRLQHQSPARALAQRQQQLSQLAARLESHAHRILPPRQERLAYLAQNLQAVSPLATLGRGYAIISSQDQAVVKDASTLKPGDAIAARLGKGQVQATVTSVDGPELQQQSLPL